MFSHLVCKRYFSEDINDELIEKLVDFYRYVFINCYFKTLLVYPTTGEFVTVGDFFSSNELIPLDVLDRIVDYPLHPITNEMAVKRYQREKMLSLFKTKLKNDAVLVTLNNQQNDICGFIFGYKRPLCDVFMLEEWANPILYSGYDGCDERQNITRFMALANEAIRNNQEQYLDETWQSAILKSDSDVFVYGAIGIHPKAQRLQNFYTLSRNFFDLACSRFKNLILVAESKKHSTAETIDMTFDVLPVDGFFTESELGMPRLLLASLDGLGDQTKISLTECLRRIRLKHPKRRQKLREGVVA